MATLIPSHIIATPYNVLQVGNRHAPFNVRDSAHSQPADASIMSSVRFNPPGSSLKVSSVVVPRKKSHPERVDLSLRHRWLSWLGTIDGNMPVKYLLHRSNRISRSWERYLTFQVQIVFFSNSSKYLLFSLVCPSSCGVVLGLIVLHDRYLVKTSGLCEISAWSLST